ncbi:MAG: monoamine oxidase [Chloroflexi bacterium]|nr:monoamine oxidase [Chloroflexota bacterium]
MSRPAPLNRRKFLKLTGFWGSSATVTSLMAACGEVTTSPAPVPSSNSNATGTPTAPIPTPATPTAAGPTPAKPAVPAVTPKGEPNNHGEIIVIGAGIAGLAAARYLQDRDFEVIILEGRGRTGGRIWTDNSLGVPLDLGAAWIHGVDGNPLTDLAQASGIKTMPTNFDALEIFGPDGTELSEEQASQTATNFNKIRKQLEQLKEAADSQVSLAAALAKLPADPNLSPILQRALRWTLFSDIENDFAADLAELSLLAWDEDKGFRGDDVIFPGGYRQITDGLAKGLDIRLNQVVTGIEYDSKGVRVTTNQGVFSGSRVVVTLPLGVLKKGGVKFTPALPGPKLQAIQRLDMGVMNKIALKFPKRFWAARTHRLGLLKEKGGKDFEFWNMEVYNGQPVLVGLAAGSYARSLEQLTKAEVVSQAMSDLKVIFGPATPAPLEAVVTRWFADPFSYGSYSHVPPGASFNDYKALAAPVGERLFFAGEATAADYPATVHGALLSGQREARAISKLM